MVLQHNPGDLDHSERALAFGLYSANSVAVGDYFGTLFGADCDAVANRIEAIEPVFKSRLDPLAVATIARAQHIDALVVTADDPAWQADWVRRTPPLYASDRVRIVPVAAMARADVASLHAPAPQVSSPVGAVP